MWSKSVAALATLAALTSANVSCFFSAVHKPTVSQQQIMTGEESYSRSFGFCLDSTKELMRK